MLVIQPNTMHAEPAASTAGHAFSDVLVALAQNTVRERISINDLLSALGDRARGALLFIFAFANLLPAPPGASAVLGAPLIFLATQLMFRLPAWLPAFIGQRSMSHSNFASLAGKTVPWLVRAEKFLRPRLTVLVHPSMECAVGLVCLLLAIVLVLPIPLGNVLPALAISLLALGVLERDGAWVVAGLTVSVIATIVVSGVIFALVEATVFLLARWSISLWF